jgi:ssDNA-binding Zn-finger/Zn-ribbon topoisomerase 1
MSGKLTTMEVIRRIREIHGDTYDLSKIEYVNRRTKVEVICKTHGSFTTRCEQLERGQGCPKCGLVSQGEKRRLPSDEFLVKCDNIHGDRYDYSKVDYQGMVNKVVINCTVHGDFEQTPSSHLNGSGCPDCGVISQIEKRRKTTDEFINESKEVHGDLYDYSKVDYIGSGTPITLICNIHGEFHPTPNNHLGGSGCPKCSIIEQHEKQKKTTNEFIRDSIKVHGDRYDYSTVEYFDSKSEVNIRCLVHGYFLQRAGNHQIGQGCPKCSKIEQTEQQRKTTEEFIIEAKEVHGDLYDYSKVEYTSSSKLVIVICKIHGDFNPISNNHLRGSGCPKCKSSKGELIINSLLTDYNIEYYTEYKFKDLIYKSKLKCDFYLLKFNLVIEYNGEQHYQPNEFFGGKKGFDRTVERDKIKKQYCLDNGINYEIIRYDEDIKYRILEILSKYGLPR